MIEPGRTLLHYRVVDKVGEGGMGVVWRATDTTLGRDVAIKILPEGVAGDAERMQRFEREAKLLASLNHPNIATVHGLLEDGGTRFLAMELVDGEDLAERLARGPLPVEEAVGVARQIAEALEAAHEHGVIHRDLKPANVIVTREGRVKVLDFGLAKSLEARTASGDPAASPTLTTPATIGGMILGTAAYMSPEQARGHEVDRRADIWAFGCVLYECLTGSRCFTGETVSDTLAAVLRAELDWSALPAKTPSALVRLLRRCLERDPRQRLRDIGEARIVLEGPLDEPARDEPAAAAPTRPRWIGVVAALALAAVTLVIGWTVHEPEPLPLRKFADATSAYGTGEWETVGPSISPDGRWITFVRDDALWLRALDSLDAREVPASDGAQGMFWSPDSRFVAYAVGLDLWKADVHGSAPVRIAQLPGRVSPAGGGAWLPDGTILMTTGGSGVLSVPSTGGDPVSYLETGERENDFHDVAVLPDGRGILFLVHGETGVSTLVAYDGEERHTLLHLEGQWMRDPVYAPSGHVLFHRSTTNIGLWALPISLDPLEATGEPFLVAPGGGHAGVSSDGTLVYLKGAASRMRQLTLFDREGRTVGTVGEPQEGTSDPAFSPDGRRVAVAAEGGGQTDIWVYDLETGTRNRLTFSPEIDFSPRWLPDGTRVAFVCGEPKHVCIRRADGSGEIEVVELDVNEAIDIGADGRTLVYVRDGRGTRADLWVHALDGTNDASEDEAFLATADFESDPRLSRNGRLLAHIAWELGMEEVFLHTFPEPTGKWQVSTAGGGDPQWSDDEIFWLEGTTLKARRVRFEPDVSLGTATTLFSSNALSWGYDVSPDGSRIVAAVTAGDNDETALVVVQNWFAEFADR